MICFPYHSLRSPHFNNGALYIIHATSRIHRCNCKHNAHFRDYHTVSAVWHQSLIHTLQDTFSHEILFDNLTGIGLLWSNLPCWNDGISYQVAAQSWVLPRHPGFREFIVGTACIMEMHGVCAQESVSLCAYIFGYQIILQLIEKTLKVCKSWCTVPLRHFFVCPLRTDFVQLNPHLAKDTTKWFVLSLSIFLDVFQFWIIGAVSMIFINSPLIPLYHHALTLKDPLLEEYRGRSGHNALSIHSLTFFLL